MLITWLLMFALRFAQFAPELLVLFRTAPLVSRIPQGPAKLIILNREFPARLEWHPRWRRVDTVADAVVAFLSTQGSGDGLPARMHQHQHRRRGVDGELSGSLEKIPSGLGGFVLWRWQIIAHAKSSLPLSGAVIGAAVSGRGDQIFQAGNLRVTIDIIITC
jgi:hypothetical protein